MSHLIRTVTLADIGDFLVPLIFVVIVVVSTIAKGIKKMGEDAQNRSQSHGADRSVDHGSGQRTMQDRLNDLAEQRRRQLQELANRRRGQGGQGQGGQGGQGGQTRQHTAPPPVPQHRSTAHASSGTMSSTSAESVEQHVEEGERRRRAKAMAEQQRRRTTAEKRERQSDQRQRQTELERQRKIAQSMAVYEGQHDAQEEDVHRHVRDAHDAPVKRRSATDWTSKLKTAGPTALQQAMVLKEIFDHPKALKDPMESPGERW